MNWGARVRAWWTRLEHRLRTSESFTVRQAAPRVFFPGCSLSGVDPGLVVRVLERLRESDPRVGLWSECCGRPLEQFDAGDGGRGEQRLAARFRDAGVQEVITACGNCAVTLERLEKYAPGLRVTSLYQVLADTQSPRLSQAVRMTVHHPCPARTHPAQREAFFALADQIGLTVVNRGQRGHALPCCLKRGPAARRRRQLMAHQQVVTYCAHCATSFQRDVPTRHVLQIFFEDEEHWFEDGKLARFENYLALQNLVASRPPRRGAKLLTAPRQGCTQSDP